MPKHGSYDFEETHLEKPRWTPAAIGLLAGAFVAFVALLVSIVLSGLGPLPFDQAILDAVVGLRSEKITEVVTWITMIAMPPTWIVVAAALSVFAKGPRPFLALVLSGAGGWTCNKIIKHIILRPRPPEELRLAVETSPSFPSGHAITAMAFFGFVIWMIWRYQPRGAWRTTLVCLTAFCILAVGLTRIYLGVHWTSDVLGGYAVGLVWLVLYTRLIAPLVLGDEG